MAFKLLAVTAVVLLSNTVEATVCKAGSTTCLTKSQLQPGIANHPALFGDGDSPCFSFSGNKVVVTSLNVHLGAQRLISLEIPVLVRLLKSSNVELG